MQKRKPLNKILFTFPVNLSILRESAALQGADSNKHNLPALPVLIIILKKSAFTPQRGSALSAEYIRQLCRLSFYIISEQPEEICEFFLLLHLPVPAVPVHDTDFPDSPSRKIPEIPRESHGQTLSLIHI